MKFSSVIKTIFGVSIALLCVGVLAFSFLKIRSLEHQEELNLYELVPASATTVFETEDMENFVLAWNNSYAAHLAEGGKGSKLFELLKGEYLKISKAVPHGMSPQMNRMLLSFHEPTKPDNQVLYCSVTESDQQAIKKLVEANVSDKFPPQICEYRGEKLRVYPLNNGGFMTCYLQKNFAVMSIQKSLVEEVVDVYKDGGSLAEEKAYHRIKADRLSFSRATMYMRLDKAQFPCWFGKEKNCSMKGWMEVDVNPQEEAIYLSGMCYEMDTLFSWGKAFAGLDDVRGFMGKLPATTYCFGYRSVSDLEMAYGKMKDHEFVRFLDSHAGKNLSASLFERTDSVTLTTGMLVAYEVADEEQAMKELSRLARKTARPLARKYWTDIDEPSYERVIHMARVAGEHVTYYKVAFEGLFENLTGLNMHSDEIYACVCDGKLWISPTEGELLNALAQVKAGLTLGETAFFREGVAGMNDVYTSLFVADVDRSLEQAEILSFVLPEHMMLYPEDFQGASYSMQFSRVGEVVYPNVMFRKSNR